MKTKDYEEFIEKNDFIMIDTCFAMRDKFPAFVNSIEMELLIHNKKIIVKDVVMAELYRLMNSSNEKVMERATRAVDVICMNKNLFVVGEKNITSAKILKAFADVEFLTDFTKNRLKHRMALLTNDFKLGRDINDLNELESCDGKKIEVYFLNKCGELEQHKFMEKSQKRETEVKPVKPITGMQEKSKNSEMGLIVLVSLVSLTTGIVIDKYGKRVINSAIKHVA